MKTYVNMKSSYAWIDNLTIILVGYWNFLTIKIDLLLARVQVTIPILFVSVFSEQYTNVDVNECFSTWGNRGAVAKAVVLNLLMSATPFNSEILMATIDI